MKPLIKAVKSFPISIFIAGPYSEAVKICKKYCDDTGFCVTVTETEYVHTSGQESGVIVGLINYPRFPSDSATMFSRASAIAELLRVGLNQESYSIQTPETTVWYSYRKGDVIEEN